MKKWLKKRNFLKFVQDFTKEIFKEKNMQVVVTVKNERDAEEMNASFLSRDYRVINSISPSVSVSGISSDHHIIGIVYFVLER